MNRRELARALSNPESIVASERRKKPWCVLGVTGAPGVGKSCLVDQIVTRWLEVEKELLYWPSTHLHQSQAGPYSVIECECLQWMLGRMFSSAL